MRRFFIILAVISLSAWSQPAPVQPPVVVQVQMPPTNPWMHILELVMPGVIGAALALLGVWLTNKRNAAENAANRQHALDVERVKDEIAAEAKSRDNRWEFRKTVYADITRTISNLLMILNESLAINRSYLSNAGNPQQESVFLTQLQEYAPRFRTASTEFLHFVNLSHLATADWVVQRILQLTPVLEDHSAADMTSPDYAQTTAATIANLNTLLKVVAEVGRKDLWGASEPQATVQAPHSQIVPPTPSLSENI